jgi:hypothetical protein
MASTRKYRAPKIARAATTTSTRGNSRRSLPPSWSATSTPYLMNVISVPIASQYFMAWQVTRPDLGKTGPQIRLAAAHAVCGRSGWPQRTLSAAGPVGRSARCRRLLAYGRRKFRWFRSARESQDGAAGVRDTLAMDDKAGAAHSTDVDVVGPDRFTYRIFCRHRGEPLKRWDGADTGFGPFDFLIFVAVMVRQAVIALRVRSRKGWIVGVMRDTGHGWQVIHRETVADDRLTSLKVSELVRAAGNGSLAR